MWNYYYKEITLHISVFNTGAFNFILILFRIIWYAEMFWNNFVAMYRIEFHFASSKLAIMRFSYLPVRFNFAYCLAKVAILSQYLFKGISISGYLNRCAVRT